jgi:superfamily I DNA/RNA helicase
MEAHKRLPPELKASNALIMTVGQSKGLEFDDVFLVDFCADSPAESEWRVLLSLLEEYEETARDIVRFIARAQNQGVSEQQWRQQLARMTAGELRLAVAAAEAGRNGKAAAAVAAVGRKGLLADLPGAAVLKEVEDKEEAEAHGWLRPLPFDPQKHR